MIANLRNGINVPVVPVNCFFLPKKYLLSKKGPNGTVKAQLFVNAVLFVTKM